MYTEISMDQENIKPSISITQWLPVIVALSVLLIPSYWSMANSLWQMDAYAHGPLALIVVAWLLWRRRALLTDSTYVATKWDIASGGFLLVMGVLFYIVGRSQSIPLLEIGAHIPLLIGVLLILRGWAVVRALWFPLAFMIFAVPLPGFIIDAATGPLKAYVSVLVESMLYTAGYPIARAGVVLGIGPYQLLVADACSGLHSLYSLSAMGALYIYLAARTQWWRNALLAALILPVAFISNIVRVVILVLVTYYFGDDAGQGFVHGLAGIVLFVVALGLLFLADAGLGYGARLAKRLRK